MNRFLSTLMLVLVLLNASLYSVPSDAGFSNNRHKIAAVCSALLATSTVGIAAGYSVAGKLPGPGFSSRVVWASDRRAIVAFLAKALRLRGAQGDDDVPKNLAREDLVITDQGPDWAKGYISTRSQVLGFELYYEDLNEVRVTIKALQL